MYYCVFTLCSIVGCAVVYREFSGIDPPHAALFGLGCVFACGGVVLITTKRPTDGTSDVAFRDLSPEAKAEELQRELASPRGCLVHAPGSLMCLPSPAARCPNATQPHRPVPCPIART